MPKNITTLEELRQEKELLKLKMKITQQAFLNNLKQNRQEAQRLVVHKIALPVGAGALASWVIQVLAKKTKEDVGIMGEPLPEEEQDGRLWWAPIVRTLIHFLESYIDQIDPIHITPSENGHTMNPVSSQEKPE